MPPKEKITEVEERAENLILGKDSIRGPGNKLLEWEQAAKEAEKNGC